LRIALQHGLFQLALLPLLLWSASSGHAQTSSPGEPHRQGVDFAVTYGTIGAQQVNGPMRWGQAGSGEIHVRLYRGLGVVALVTGQHIGSSSAQTAPVSFVTVVFGPRFTVDLSRTRFSVFGQGLVGEADGFQSLFAVGSGQVANPGNGTTSSASALALEAGGGLEFKLKRHISLRLAQVEYVRTQFPNGGTNTQNNLRVSVGVSFKR
jgi:hypothetical protein